MRTLHRFAFYFLLATATCVSSFAAHQQTGALDPAPQAAAVRILTPSPGQSLTTDYIDVRYELVRPALSNEPNFLVQLDSADPVQTSETTYTFSDVQPGAHTLRVTLVDANKSPVQGGTAVVQFKITATPPAARDGSRGAFELPADAIAALTPSAPVPPELLTNGDLNLPMRGSPLPLLSLIGFGLLVGGAARAMRTP